MSAETTEAAPPTPRRRRPVRALLVAIGLLALLAAALAATARYGVLTPPGRRLAESALNGLKVGGYGRLNVEGLDGDLWRDFTLRHLTISDAQGVWLDARSVRLRWDWRRLFERHLTVNEIDAAKLTVLHAPARESGGRGGPSPVSLEVRKIAARLELEPAFSRRYGLYDVEGGFEMRRAGGMAGHLDAASLTRAGDHLDVAFDLGRDQTIRLALDLREAKGGAMAGSAGLAADQPFYASASATGTTSAGRFQLESRSGDASPAEAQGAWTPQGGEADGRITLAASRLLAGYQRMLGPEARFRVTGAKAADSLNAMTLAVTSENVDLTAAGDADLGRRIAGPKGVAMTLLARQAQRLIGWPAMGAARFAGTLSGRMERGALTGQLTVQSPSALGYQLAQVSGPARLSITQTEGPLDLKRPSSRFTSPTNSAT